MAALGNGRTASRSRSTATSISNGCLSPSTAALPMHTPRSVGPLHARHRVERRRQPTVTTAPRSRERMQDCSRCTVVPAPPRTSPDGVRRVMLHTPAPLAAAKVFAAVRAAGFTVAGGAGSMTWLEGPAECWDVLLSGLGARLTPPEMAETRVALLDEVPADPMMLAAAAFGAQPL